MVLGSTSSHLGGWTRGGKGGHVNANSLVEFCGCTIVNALLLVQVLSMNDLAVLSTHRVLEDVAMLEAVVMWVSREARGKTD